MKMTQKAFISDKTWRTHEQQVHAISEHLGDEWADIPLFDGESGLAAILRPTRRNEKVTMIVASLAVLAKTEIDFLHTLTMIRHRKVDILSVETGALYQSDGLAKNVIRHWKMARSSGAAKIGGRISADKKKAATKEAANRIADRWPMPSKEWPTKVLLKEADISLNTAKAHLGKRPIAQYNYQAKLKRAANRVKK